MNKNPVSEPFFTKDLSIYCILSGICIDNSLDFIQKSSGVSEGLSVIICANSIVFSISFVSNIIVERLE